MHSLCILKQSVEVTLKVQGKSLATVSGSFYSLSVQFLPTLNPLGESFLSQVKSFARLQGRITSKTSPYFSVNPFYLRISQVPSQNQQNAVLITTLVLQDQPQGRIFSYFYKLPRVLSPSVLNSCYIFSQTFVFHHLLEKFLNLQISHSQKMH